MYRSTLSQPTVEWKDGQAPIPVPPKEEGNWVLVGAPCSINKNLYQFLVWTWIDLDQAIKQGVQVGTALAEQENQSEPRFEHERPEGCSCDPQRNIEEFGHHMTCKHG